MFRYGLSWPQARALLVSGSYVRRERWTDKRLFLTSGGLVWVDATPARVVQAADFGRAEFLAKDWTDMGFDQGDCVDHPGWTHISIDETLQVQQLGWVIAPKNGKRYEWTSPFAETVTARIWANSGYYGRGAVAMSGITFLRVSPIPYDPRGGNLNGIYSIAPGAKLAVLGYGGISVDPPTGQARPLLRTIPNPFSAGCQVEITGSARDVLLLNGREALLPATFVLAEGGTFTLEAKLLNPAVQPVAALDLEVDFSL